MQRLLPPPINVKKYLVATLLILLSSTATAQPPFTGYTALYSLTWHGVRVGTSTHTLRLTDDSTYDFSLEAHSTLPLVSYRLLETSSGYWTREGFHPEHYLFEYKKGKEEHDRQMNFNYEDKQVNQVNSKKHWSLTKKTQDIISHQLTMREDLIEGKDNFIYRVVDGHKVRTYQFKRRGIENIKTPLGKMDAIKMERNAHGRQTTIWYAPQLNYLPVKIVQMKKGKVQGTAVLKKLSA